mmetsp:Transcript_11299/g.28591  ORF Transcript_11299/g.28591 Transcript_11299/m.28591 type:complete len:228 (-) Transcript_11299:1509-2192(-)
MGGREGSAHSRSASSPPPAASSVAASESTRQRFIRMPAAYAAVSTSPRPRAAARVRSAKPTAPAARSVLALCRPSFIAQLKRHDVPAATSKGGTLEDSESTASSAACPPASRTAAAPIGSQARCERAQHARRFVSSESSAAELPSVCAASGSAGSASSATSPRAAPSSRRRTWLGGSRCAACASTPTTASRMCASVAPSCRTSGPRAPIIRKCARLSGALTTARSKS